MARIVCVFPGMTGILHSTLELANRLRSAGHEVVLGCPWDMREPVERHGFEYMQFEPIDFDPVAPADHAPTDGRLRRAVRSVATVRRRREEAVEALGQRDFADRMEAVGVDLVLIDLELHEFVLTAVERGLPVALLSQFFELTKRPGLPPIDSALVPAPVGPTSRAAIGWAWLRSRLRRWKARSRDSLRSLFADRRAVLTRYARRAGFPLARLHSDTFLQPFAYSGMPMVRMTLPELEFPHDVEPEARYVGPMVFVERGGSDPGEIDPSLARAFREAERNGRRLILCSVTTVGGADVAFLSRVVEVASRRPEWVLVIGLGGKVDPQMLGTLPPNVVALGWVPQLDVLARADLAIIHGGINTIHECIHFRVPMLVYSGKKHDQNGCAARLAYHGLGLMGDKDVDGAADIEEKIEHVLSEPSFKANVEVANARYRAMRADGIATRVVEELIRNRPTTDPNHSEMSR